MFKLNYKYTQSLRIGVQLFLTYTTITLQLTHNLVYEMFLWLIDKYYIDNLNFPTIRR